jgi:quinol monooxygenase YgiN
MVSGGKSNMIVVVATVRVAEGKGGEFEKAYKALAPKVRKDPGAITYVLNRDNKDPNKYLFYEKYENEEAIKYHGSAPHVREFFKNMGPIMLGKVEITQFTEV